MKKIIVKENQTLFDVALECYGTVEAVSEILELNPDVMNSPSAKVDAGIDYVSDTDFYIDLAVKQGSLLTINPDSELRQPSTLRELRGTEITTYHYGTND